MDAQIGAMLLVGETRQRIRLVRHHGFRPELVAAFRRPGWWDPDCEARSSDFERGE